MMSPIQSHSLAGLALIVLTAGGCVTALASPSSNPLASATVPPAASATVPPPVRLQFVDDEGTTMTFTVDIDDQSGLLVEATDGGAFSTEDPGANDLVYEGNYVVFFERCLRRFGSARRMGGRRRLCCELRDDHRSDGPQASDRRTPRRRGFHRRQLWRHAEVLRAGSRRRS